MTVPAPAQTQDETIRVSTNEVLLDAVVRDKRGRPVQDLTADDFEIFEDGVRQDISSFRLVRRATAARAPEGAAGARRAEEATPPARAARPADPVGGVSAIALVFDRLSPDARSMAHKAALSYVRENVTLDDFVGVFVIDLSLHVLQSYTSDAQLIRQAIDRAGSRTTSSFSSNTAQVRQLSDRQEALERSTGALQSQTSSGTASAGEAGSASGANAVEQKFAEMAMRAMETFEAMERDQQGYATTNGLLAVTNSLGRLPGRKAIVFFSEGLAIPPAVQSRFRSVISTANRANVSIYAVDAAGLRVTSASDEQRREIAALGQRRLRQMATGREDTTGPMTRSLERNEDLLRLNPHSGLGQLANETGGLLISDTNDLGERLRRVDEDLHTYYALTYAPKNQSYDGRFRQVEVKLKRAGLDVQARKGYFAIGPGHTAPALEHEAVALALLGTGRPASAFPLWAGAMNFPEPNRPGLVPVLVEVPASALTFSVDQEKKQYTTDFSIVALVRDESQQVASKLSSHYRLSGPLDKLEEARRGDILFYKTADLAPGRYALQVAAYDAPSGKASVRTSALEVPGAAGDELRLSSVVIVGRGERITPADQNAAQSPFSYQEVLIYPALGKPLKKSVSKQLPFFFTAYSAAKGAAPKLAIEILQNGKSLGKIAGDLPAPDASGRIKYANALPLDKFPPGGYQLRITVTDGARSVARSADFTVEP